MRHPDVENRHVGLEFLDRGQRLGAVREARDHLDSVLGASRNRETASTIGGWSSATTHRSEELPIYAERSGRDKSTANRWTRHSSGETSSPDTASLVTVLIAEDDRNCGACSLRSSKPEDDLQLVGAACDADEAIDLAARDPPDVAIVDVRMPGGGGVKVARELRRSAPDTKVLALTAAADRDTVLEMLEAGVVGYLVKGSSAEHILESIGRAGSGQSMLSAEVTGEVISELVGQLGSRRRGEEKERRRRRRIDRAIADEGALQVVFQPICALDTLEPAGFEALVRFQGPPQRGPEHWFREAAQVDLSIELELVAVQQALAHLPRARRGHVHVDQRLARHRCLGSLQARARRRAHGSHRRRDHRARGDRGLRHVQRRRSQASVRWGCDWRSTTRARLCEPPRHILRLEPELIKLDITLIAAIESDRSQQALAAGIISFAEGIGATVVAEGSSTRRHSRRCATSGCRSARASISAARG